VNVAHLVYTLLVVTCYHCWLLSHYVCSNVVAYRNNSCYLVIFPHIPSNSLVMVKSIICMKLSFGRLSFLMTPLLQMRFVCRISSSFYVYIFFIAEIVVILMLAAATDACCSASFDVVL